MTEELNQKISQLLDDDLSYEEALDVLTKLKGQPELLRKMSRYEATSHVLKSDAFIPVQPDFAQCVSAAIDKEPTFLAVRRRPLAYPYWALTALAASVMIVAVLVTKQEHQFEPPVAGALMLASTEKPEAQSQQVQVQSVMHDQNSQPDPIASRLTEYLQAHNSSRYIDGTVSLQPYAQVVSYSQE
ncbi:MAG: sigma-E factor negative regulatory protein [Gammaproteobacteria bacterium]